MSQQQHQHNGDEVRQRPASANSDLVVVNLQDSPGSGAPQGRSDGQDDEQQQQQRQQRRQGGERQGSTPLEINFLQASHSGNDRRNNGDIDDNDDDERPRQQQRSGAPGRVETMRSRALRELQSLEMEAPAQRRESADDDTDWGDSAASGDEQDVEDANNTGHERAAERNHHQHRRHRTGHDRAHRRHRHHRHRNHPSHRAAADAQPSAAELLQSTGHMPMAPDDPARICPRPRANSYQDAMRRGGRTRGNVPSRSRSSQAARVAGGNATDARPGVSTGSATNANNPDDENSRSNNNDKDNGPGSNRLQVPEEPRRGRRRHRLMRLSSSRDERVRSVSGSSRSSEASLPPVSPTTRRSQLLRAAGNQPDFSRQNLHRLFRIFDADNDGRLKHSEFKSGLLAMGMKEAEDNMAVGRLIEAIDIEGDGTIHEDEFITFFRQIKMDQLQDQLNEWQASVPSSVEVVSYNPYDSTASTNEIQADAILDWLKTKDVRKGPDAFQRDWVIIKGYNDSITQVLGLFLHIHEETYQDVVTFQRDKIEVLDAENRAGCIAQMLMSIYTLDNSPFVHGHSKYDPGLTFRRDYRPDVERASRSQGANHNHSHDSQSRLAAFFTKNFWPAESPLVSKRHLSENPPLISSHPLSNIIVSDTLLITIIRDPENEELDESAPPVPNPVYDVIDEVRGQILQRFSDVMTGNAKYLSYIILEAVTEQNYNLRDTLKTWLGIIDDGISDRPQSIYRSHLFDFAKIATAYTREMSALKEVLTQNSWESDEAQLTQYFSEQAVYFRDLSDQLSSIVSELEEIQEVIQNLFQVYRSYQDEKMNSFLLLLTIVTAVFIPAQFLTGLWGMNFENMPELKLKYGYVMFWALVVVLTTVVLLWFRIKGLWLLD